MIPTAVLSTLATVLLLAAPSLRAAPQADGKAVEADWILDRLARPAPMRTGFVELRESKLLKQPLRLSGEYRRPADGVLVREVRAPYAETTTIRANEATIERAGKSPRTFSLSRAPELAGLQASFGALLSGDRAGLAEHYTIESEGTRGQWTLTLVPKRAELAAQVRDIVLRGRGAELRCIETRTPGDAAPQRTLLAGAARAAGKVDDAAGLAALCHGDGPGAQ
ncbi:LolA-related protein [Lysobacter sp. F60174L2]|uniref:LolA-related protein n=1 Tax=Lysobacter sp. F60174L2 TaxID=3459295 RepID=UPI00403DD043